MAETYEDSNDSIISDSISVSAEEDKQMCFVILLKEHKVLLEKSQVPAVKAAKQKALRVMLCSYQQNTGVALSEKQLMKKINNVKTELRKKTDLNKTGNRKITLKPWEKLLLELLDYEKNPAFPCLPGEQTITLLSMHILLYMLSSVVPNKSKMYLCKSQRL